jgi:pyroglutamyl-peptidase
MKWLVSAFEPFAGASTNSSLLIVEKLSEMNWDGAVDFFFPLTVTYADAWRELERKLTPSNSYDGILCLGQAENRKKISFERLALNWIDASLPDNQGIKIQNQRIIAGPDVLWSPIPWDKLDLPHNCERSYSAGTFVCNHLMYSLLQWAQLQKKLAGFVHIPLVHGQENDFPEKELNPQDEITHSLVQAFNFLIHLK